VFCGSDGWYRDSRNTRSVGGSDGAAKASTLRQIKEALVRLRSWQAHRFSIGSSIFNFIYALCLHDDNTTDKMASQQALNKIAPNSPSRAKPSEIEQSIATALYELEVCYEACNLQTIY
jgi:hypothetical protein